MSEMERRQSEIDALLRRCLAGPVPRLSVDFQDALSRESRRRSRTPTHFSRILFASYGGLSAVTSIVVMRCQGLGWVAIVVTTLSALAAVEAARRLQRNQWKSASK
jgi:hypothetical protein